MPTTPRERLTWWIILLLAGLALTIGGVWKVGDGSLLAFVSLVLGPGLVGLGGWAFIGELSRAGRAPARPHTVRSTRMIAPGIDRAGRHNSHLHGRYPLHVLGESEF